MRKLLVTALLAAGITAQAQAATSNWDGLYNCNVGTIYQGRTIAVTTPVAINTKNLAAIFTIPATAPSNIFYGRGIGTIATDAKANNSGLSNNTFKGKTDTGNPFSFNIDKFNIIRGTITMLYVPANLKINATVACSKSW